METLIVTPMPQELGALLQGFIKRRLRHQDSAAGRLPLVRIPGLNLALAVGGTGKAQFAAQTQHLLDAKEWDLVVCAGAAGALTDSLAVGDVIVATATVEHDYKNRFNDNPVPSFDGDPSTIASLERASRQCNGFAVHFGAMASGDEDIVDRERKLALRAATQALGVAWEGAGGARACKFAEVPFVEIRALTDRASPASPADFLNNLETALDNVSELITGWKSAQAGG